MKKLLYPCLCLIILSLACNYTNPPMPIAPYTPTPAGSPAATAASLPAETPATGQTEESKLPTPAAGSLIVAYIKDGNLRVWSQGQSRQLTHSGDVNRPRLSPDGKVIAYLRPADDYHLEIWAIDVDGKNERKLVSVADLDAIGGGVRDPSALAINPYHFAWLPGTHQLAYNTHQIFQGPGSNLLNDLNLVEADTLQKSNLLLSGWGGEFVYAPDGSQIAITQPDKVILAKADGSDYHPLMNYPAVTTYSEYRYYAAPVWAADGKSLRLALPPVDPLATPQQPTSLWRIPLDGSDPVQMGSVNAVPFFEQPVEFSPDLGRIAFVEEVGQPTENLRELYLAASDGSGDSVYARAAALHFQGWAPDANHFAYTLGEAQELWLGSLQEAPRQPGGGMNGVQDLRWVGGSSLLFWQASGGSLELVLADLQGGTVLLDSVTGGPDFDFIP
jgi:dipeptidyl aminopeptidase/acylaminoacyl peptidase